MDGAFYLSQQGTSEQSAKLESEFDSDSSEDSKEGTQLRGPDEDVFEFGDTELEDLVDKEGPQHILQLAMQNKIDNLLKEELIDADDYANWIKWAAEEEQRMQSLSEAANAVEESVLLQIQEMEITDSSGDVKEQITRNPKEDTRPGMTHANADALSQNPVGQAMDDEDFHQKIQDDSHTQHGVPEADEKVLVVWHG
ncbi:unnamed protein product [Sphagnum jensenii]|uniref:Uncharacterized protein n=1 Tax=Sphagnum jensenii TaxID=128206 RepID=A0ABP1B6V8_9BRYO